MEENPPFVGRADWLVSRMRLHVANLTTIFQHFRVYKMLNNWNSGKRELIRSYLMYMTVSLFDVKKDISNYIKL